jgi:DNA polymerase-3 subunit delta
MPQTNTGALIRRLKERPAAAVVFLHGAEEFLRERAVHAILDTVLDPATRDFNLDQVRGTDVEPETLASLLATPPMMAEYRLVIVRDAQALSAKGREAVEAVVARPYSGLILVVAATIPSGTKAKFYDVLRANAMTVEFGLVDATDLPGWIIEHGSGEHGVEIDVDAARAWAAAIGPQLGVLSTEVGKAVSYIGDRRRITLEDVKAVGGYIPRVDRWAWLDLVGERRFKEALAQIPDLLTTGENGVGLVLALGSHFLKLGMLVDGGRDGLDRYLRSNQRWLANKLQPQARRWTRPQIDGALSDLLRADRLLKSA